MTLRKKENKKMREKRETINIESFCKAVHQKCAEKNKQKKDTGSNLKRFTVGVWMVFPH